MVLRQRVTTSTRRPVHLSQRHIQALIEPRNGEILQKVRLFGVWVLGTIFMLANNVASRSIQHVFL